MNALRPVAGARWTLAASPVGGLLIGADGDAVTHLWFPPPADGRSGRGTTTGSAPAGDAPPPPARTPPGRRADDDALLTEASSQLAEYFRGERTAFTLPLDPRGTPFELRVWRRLLAIPYAETVSYGDVARDVAEHTAAAHPGAAHIATAGAAQAVGRAVGANPIGVVIPCHRVIGADGSMTGFAGGIACKTYLLDLEGYVTGTTLLPPRFDAVSPPIRATASWRR